MGADGWNPNKAKEICDREDIMPLYVYYCRKCMKVYEAIVPLKDWDKPVKCPHCEEEMKKQPAPVMFIIK